MKTFWQSLNTLSKGLLFMGGHLVGTTAIDVAAQELEQAPKRSTGEREPEACAVAIACQANPA